MVEGAPFTYQEGAGVSLGATSPLTVGIHALGYLVGFRGAAMPLFALLAGVGALAWAGWSALTLGRRLTPAVPWLPPALLLTSGPVIWASLSGMDFAFFLCESHDHLTGNINFQDNLLHALLSADELGR